MTEPAETFGQRIKLLVNTFGDRKVGRFARKAGMQTSTVAGWIKKGRGNPKPEQVERLRVTFGVRPEWLLTGAGSMQETQPAPQRLAEPPGATLDLQGISGAGLDVLGPVLAVLKTVAGTLEQTTPEQRAMIGTTLAHQLVESLERLQKGDTPRGVEGRDRGGGGLGH